MKTKSILSIILLFCSITIFAQHPLIGTWEFVSIQGTDADGKRVDWNNANMRETKIITPTHYMLIQHTVRNDSVIFNTAHAGTVKIEGNKYIETPTVTSAATVDIAKTDFTWKVKGDQFIQAGTITLPDGKKIILDELVFKKISGPSANTKNPIVGTWNQLSSEYTLFDGTKDSHTSPAVTRFDIFTPSNWARIGHRDGKFESAMISSYILQNGKIEPTVIVASSPIYAHKYEISYRVDGSKLYVNGRATNAEGKQFTWNDVFQKTSDK